MISSDRKIMNCLKITGGINIIYKQSNTIELYFDLYNDELFENKYNVPVCN